MAHDVFISHSSKDKATADAVCARLEARGIRCWVAPRDVPHGANYGAAIIDAIHGSRVMVLVLSSHANASLHIPNEIERAVSHGVTVLPFRIEDVQPAKSLDLFIGSVHWLDAVTPPLERHLDQLADSVDRLLPGLGRQAAPPSPLPPPVLPPVPPPPRPDLVKMAAIVVAAVALTSLAWLVLGRDAPVPERTGSNTEHTPPASEGSPGPGSAAPPVSDPQGGDHELVGCWRWANNAVIEIRADGSISSGPFAGEWRRRAPRQYTLTWPEPVDTLTLSSDGRRLSGGNQYGVAVTATRVSGGPALPGTWLWGGAAPVELAASGAATLGSLAGRWTSADRGRRVYRVTWPKIQEQVTLSGDRSRLQGGNQYGAAVSGVRLPACP